MIVKCPLCQRNATWQKLPRHQQTKICMKNRTPENEDAKLLFSNYFLDFFYFLNGLKKLIIYIIIDMIPFENLFQKKIWLKEINAP